MYLVLFFFWVIYASYKFKKYTFQFLFHDDKTVIKKRNVFNNVETLPYKLFPLFGWNSFCNRFWLVAGICYANICYSLKHCHWYRTVWNPTYVHNWMPNNGDKNWEFLLLLHELLSMVRSGQNAFCLPKLCGICRVFLARN